MAKGKSSKKTQNNVLKSVGNDKKSKVSESPASVVEKWDVVRTFSSTDEEPCRMDDCESPAVECWSSNLEPDDEWSMCRACVDAEFGPEIPSHDDDYTNAAPQDDASLKLSSAETIVTEPTSTTIDDETTTAIDNVNNETDSIKHVSDSSSEDNGGGEDDDEKNSSDDDSTNHDGTQETTSVETLTVEIPANPAVVETPAETPAVETPGEKPSTVETPTVETPAHPFAVETPVETPAVETPVKTSFTVEAVVETLTSTPHALDTVSHDDPAVEKWDVVRKIDSSSNESTACRMDDCERSATECWASNIEPEDIWEMCTECVELEFGPEESTVLDSKAPNQGSEGMLSPAMPLNSKGALDPGPTEAQDMRPTPAVTSGATDTANSPVDDSEDEAEEAWDVKKVMSHSDLSKDGTIKCGTETCILAAAAIYMSTLTKEKWYTCLDCQVVDYGGWPEKLKEIPIKSMTHEHKQIMAQKCSRLSSPVFPKFIESPTKATNSANTLTPPPNGENQVTPTPTAKRKSQPSAQAMAIHRKWQAAAESVGGPEARIVVDKKAAKQLVVDLLYDAFRPMNITQIHSALKAVVPSPVLKQCLDDMALDKDDDENMFAESDDDEPKEKKKKKPTTSSTEEFAGALIFKAGRSVNTSLYFLDHSKQKNDGNGLEIDARNQLHTDKALADQERDNLRSGLNRMGTDTKRLLGEPTNEVTNVNLETAEAAMTNLRDSVEEARKLKVNEKHKQQTKRRIEGMTVQWRKRRRLCMDFLISMEENTDGTISMKKCLSGDGQIDVESDEKAIKDSKTYAETKRARKKFRSGTKKSSMGKKSSMISSSQIAADENFIGVLLNSQGLISRVFLDNNDDDK